MMTDTPLVQVEQLTRCYGNTRAVAALSFTLQRGQVLGLLGVNGAGKSTTLQLLAGCLAPDSGRIRLNGCDLLTAPRQAKRQLGYLPEQPPLYRELTVDEYLHDCAHLRRLPRRAIPAAVDQAKQRCGLTTVSRRLLGHLSKGYQQRVGIAQAILHQPAVIILDEPTVGLDPVQIRDIRELIRELGREHGVILSSHRLSEVQALCSQVLILHQGRAVYTGDLSELDRSVATGWLVRFGTPPAVDRLAALPGIERVEPLAGDRFRLWPTVAADPLPTLVATACTEGWDLRELIPERGGLEQRFIELTLGQTEPAT
jgi:ABC-2 type transport system ATP-binding protein